MAPSIADVLDFLGEPIGPDPAYSVEQITAHLNSVTATVNAYTRGQGFDLLTGEPGADLAAVIISATARQIGNPAGNLSDQAGPFTVRHGIIGGWTLAELAILHTYRRRAA